MKVQVIKEYEVKFCNECPFFKEVEDTSVCIDSFDDPNYDFYCTNSNYDNSGDDREKWNNPKYGKFIGSALSRFGKCNIPKRCPFKNSEEV